MRPCFCLFALCERLSPGALNKMGVDDKRPEAEERTRGWRRVRRYAPLVVWMTFIFFVSTGEFSASNTSRIIGPLLRWLFPNISEENLVLAHYITRKVAHFTEYAILAWLAARAFVTSSKQALRQWWFFAALLLIVLYSLSDEYHQSFVPTRTGSIYDSFIDMSGGLAALLLYALWRRRAQSH
jgi:VanZ family protein